jgi:hypothetical protein
VHIATARSADSLKVLRDVAAAGAVVAPALAVGPVRSGAPALGYVDKLRVVGNKLYADLLSLHPQIRDALLLGKCKKIALGVYENLVRNGQRFRHALRHISLEGIPEPTIKLVPTTTIEAFQQFKYAGRVHTYSSRLDDDDSWRATQDDATGEVVANRVSEYQEENPGVSYEQALVAVFADDPVLKDEYLKTLGHLPADEPNPHSGRMSPPPTRPESENAEEDRRQAGEELSKFARVIMAHKTNIDFEEAFRQACHQHPHLAARYHGHDYR